MLCIYQHHMANEEVQELLFKVLVVGDMGTGKTAVIRRYVNHSYTDGYKATVSVVLLSHLIIFAHAFIRLELILH